MASNSNRSESTSAVERERRKVNGQTAKRCLLIMLAVGVLDAFSGFDLMATVFSYVALPFLDAASTEYAVWEGNVGLFFFGVKAVMFTGAGIVGYLSVKNNEA